MTLQANTAACFSRLGDARLLGPPVVEVRINGRSAPRVRLECVEHEMGAAPVARFAVGLGRDPTTGEDLRLENAAATVLPGSSVTATLLRGGVLPGTGTGDLSVFAGRIRRLDLSLSAEREALVFEAEDPTADLLRRRVGGQRAWTADGPAARLEGDALVFNPNGRPNATETPYDPGTGRPYTIFAPVRRAGNTAWTLDEAVAYLLAEHTHSDAVDVPSPEEVRSALPATVIRDVSLEGQSLGEALDALLELAGARIVPRVDPAVGTVRRRLEIWHPGIGPVGWLCHQPVGERYDPARTHFAGIDIRMQFGRAPRRYVARGDRKFYESTFELVAGWDEALASYDPDDFSPETNPAFENVRDVFRKWVLNEAGDYSGPPYSRGAAADLSAVFEGAPYTRRRRRFLPCLSRDGAGRSRGVYLEVSVDGGTSWEQAALSARVLRSECGVYLTGDPLPAAYLAAAMRGDVRVRVTATIESDSLLRAEAGDEEADGLPGRTRYLNVPAGYRFRRVAPDSRFWGQGNADEVDDSAALETLVLVAWQADRRSPAPARVEVPYLAFGYSVGTRMAGIRGRRLDLARQHTGFAVAPVVRRVHRVFAPEPQTVLELE